jgi:WXG100 family type VII secretion target
MAITHGMNVATVEQISTDLKTQAGELTKVISKVNSIMTRVAEDWKGKDATAFASEWNDKHRAALTSLQTQLTDLATKASKNAKEQTTASGN